MNALVQRFSVQRYLTPAEMKNLAELTGMTYKQVKILKLLDLNNYTIGFPALILISCFSLIWF